MGEFRQRSRSRYLYGNDERNWAKVKKYCRRVYREYILKCNIQRYFVLALCLGAFGFFMFYLATGWTFRSGFGDGGDFSKVRGESVPCMLRDPVTKQLRPCSPHSEPDKRKIPNPKDVDMQLVNIWKDNPSGVEKKIGSSYRKAGGSQNAGDSQRSAQKSEQKSAIFKELEHPEDRPSDEGDDDEVDRTGSSVKMISVAIVEEHHDVVKWWYHGASVNAMPHFGNTLLHFDAHSDLALPFIDDTFPLFRYPRNQEESKYLMQSNDMFIAAVALTGMFRRFIWVVPPWASDAMEVVGWSGYRRFHVMAGISTTPIATTTPPPHSQGKKDTSEENKDYHRLCYCVKSNISDRLPSDWLPEKYPNSLVKNNLDNVEMDLCYRHNKFKPDRDWHFTERTPRHTCLPLYRLTAEFVSEDMALQLLKKRYRKEGGPLIYNPKQHARQKDKKKSWDDRTKLSKDKVVRPKITSIEEQELIPAQTPWLTTEDSVLVDIDLDYYGVQSGIEPLLEENIEEKAAFELSHTIGEIFCASDRQEEEEANKKFVQLLKMMYDDLCTCENDIYCVFSTLEHANKFSVQLVALLETPFVQSYPPPVFLHCSTGRVQEIQRNIDLLVRELMLFNGRQLRALSKVGICLRRSPNTFGFDRFQGMVLCFGRNTPGRSAVPFHVPDDEELHERTLKLLAMFQNTTYTPGMITIARSVRDGYTPRQLHDHIESDVMYILQHAYPGRITPETVTHDADLLGGVGGWNKTRGGF